MPSVTGGSRNDFSLAAGQILTVASVGHGVGYVSRFGDRPGDAGHGVTDVGDGETVTFGPFTAPARFEVACTSGSLSYSAAVADVTATDIGTGGTVGITETYSGAGSYQPVWADLELTAGAGAGTLPESDFLAPIMGNVLGADLTAQGNHIGGVIGALSVTGAKASEYEVGAVVGVAMDGVTTGTGVVVAVIDGSDPSSETRVNAAFAARMNNNNAASGVDYGLDLYDAGRSAQAYTGGGLPLAFAKAAIRLNDQVCLIVDAGAPTSGAAGTGDNFAGPGSLYIDITGANIYVQIGAITAPDWKLVTRAA